MIMQRAREWTGTPSGYASRAAASAATEGQPASTGGARARPDRPPAPRSPQDPRRVKSLAAVAAASVAVALVAAAYGTWAALSAQAAVEAANADAQPTLVAADDIPAGEVLAASSFEVRSVPRSCLLYTSLLFFSECAAFDRVAREAVRVHAASPACGQGLEQSCALVSQTVEQAFDRPYVGTRVAVEGTAGGHARFTATIEFSPTLFGLGLKSSVFGVALPHLEHAVSLTVDPYKPGVLL